MKVAVSGAAGRMGTLVVETIRTAPDLELGGVFDPSAAEGTGISTDPEVVRGADVVVEFTVPEVVMTNLDRWRAMGVHAVVGTSGFTEGRVAEVRRAWGSGPPNCLITPNFSIGAVLMMRFAELAAPHFAAAEVIELHHDQKADAPSGTAVNTAGRIAAAKPDQQRRVESAELIEGVRGADVDGVAVHGIRLPGLLAHQEVLFGNDGELLTIRHDTSDRKSFMAGVLLAVRNVGQLPGVTVGIEGLLGL
ncbi:MAG: 4-hydroxy-tetrahydrodipicolinate reductase [Acidimicrobiia bacterium]|nr:4-hydroxy-tetrahydrodipicolinate reductase [Acidimicrobiia bacterium]NNC92189.1 4-hydroxy-tetrahydrodipicolinate reductase [Acidimicrobiia bacterium]